MKNNKRKFSILTVCLLLTVLISVGGTIAYIFTSTGSVTNTFTPVEPGTEIEEFLENNVKKNVTVKNTGEVDSYIRAKIVVTWQNAAGEVYKTLPTAADYSISYGADWTKGNDGYYYYNKSVAAKGSTTELIAEAKPLTSCEDSSYTLHIEILSQAIQSTPVTAVDAWDNVNVELTGNTSGTLTVTNKSAS